MPKTQQSLVLNRLLLNMGEADFASIEPDLEQTDLPLGQEVFRSNEKITHVLFPENAVVSVIGTTAGGQQSEVGLVGCEGAIGLAVIDGIDASPLEAFIQIPGQAYQIRADALTAASEASPTLRKLLHVYAQSFLIQVSYSAMAHAISMVGPRLARWLLMSQDRVGGDDVVMTHDALSLMLAVRRAGVTVALQVIEAQGTIKTRRGMITIIDRRRLLAIAGDAYGAPEAEYRRLLGFDLKTTATGGSAYAGAGCKEGKKFHPSHRTPVLSVVDLETSIATTVLAS